MTFQGFAPIGVTCILKSYAGKLRHEHKKHHTRERRPTKGHKVSTRGSKNRDMSKTKSVPDKMSQMSFEGEEGEDDGPPGGYQALSIQVSSWVCSRSCETKCASLSHYENLSFEGTHS